MCVCVGDNPLRASPQSVSCVSSVFLVANPLLEQPFAVMKTRTLHGERLPPVPQDWRTQERIRTDIPGFGRVGRHLACIDLQARDNRTDWTSSVDCSVTYGDNTSQQVNQLCLYRRLGGSPNREIVFVSFVRACERSCVRPRDDVASEAGLQIEKNVPSARGSCPCLFLRYSGRVANHC